MNRGQIIMKELSPIIYDGVLKPIYKHLVSKGVTNITIEELCDVLNTSAPEEPKRIRKKKVSNTVLKPEDRCEYIIQRGQKQDQRCEGVKFAGEDFCRVHKDRKSVKKKKDEALKNKTQPEDDDVTIRIEPIPDTEFFKIDETSYIVKRERNGNTVCFGKIGTSIEDITALNDNDQQTILDMGLGIASIE